MYRKSFCSPYCRLQKDMRYVGISSFQRVWHGLQVSVVADAIFGVTNDNTTTVPSMGTLRAQCTVTLYIPVSICALLHVCAMYGWGVVYAQSACVHSRKNAPHSYIIVCKEHMQIIRPTGSTVPGVCRHSVQICSAGDCTQGEIHIFLWTHTCKLDANNDYESNTIDEKSSRLFYNCFYFCVWNTTHAWE